MVWSSATFYQNGETTKKLGERWISIRFDMWIRHESVLNNRNCYHSDNSYSCYNIDALCEHATVQAACKKKVVSNSPGLVDFAIELLNFILNLTDVQVQFFEEFKLQSKNCVINAAHQKVFGAKLKLPLLSGIML